MTNEFINKKKQIFDSWAPSYDWLFPSVFYQAVHKRLLSYVDFPPQPSVLDLGCGTGRLLERLAAEFPELRGTGLDLSPQMLRVARQRNRYHPRLIYIQGNAESLPFAAGQFDAVFNTISFLHYPQPQQVLSEVARVLKTGGRFYLVDSSFSSHTAGDSIPFLLGGMRFYSKTKREVLGSEVGLSSKGHYYLLSPVLLTVFVKN
ncbi:MAG: class I SAM-dependent methyltransferase [Nostocaceae cyanobacterium]|nr:class I SAM-dependent methyltransferase [Nostocaceae cyanobacterium]